MNAIILFLCLLGAIVNYSSSFKQELLILKYQFKYFKGIVINIIIILHPFYIFILPYKENSNSQQQIHTQQIIIMAENNRLDLQFLASNKLQTQSTFSILCEGQSNQILQISIPPNCSNYICGNVVYTNSTEQQQVNYKTTFKWRNIFKKGVNMFLWRNRSQQMQIVGLTHLNKRGPILILDMSVYKESLYINISHLFVSKYSLESNTIYHSNLPLHVLVQFKEKAGSLDDFFKNNQKIALQAKSPIIEKYLGIGEPFTLKSGEVLAFSKSMTVEKASFGLQLVGPGWVFFQSSPQRSAILRKLSTIFLFVLIYLSLMQMILLY